jgi:hypothetical protein
MSLFPFLNNYFCWGSIENADLVVKNIFARRAGMTIGSITFLSDEDLSSMNHPGLR